MRINLSGDRLSMDNLLHLLLEFGNPLGTASGHGLVTRSEDAFAPKSLVQRVKGDQSNSGSAVGVRNDALVPFNVFRVYFRDDQRHLIIHAESARIVDHNTSGSSGHWSEFSGNARPGAE